jgi:lactoylglutathione lyase
VVNVAGVHHTGLTVAELERSLAFYRDLLGFEVVLDQEKEGGYLAAIVGYPDARVRMAHLRLPGSEHRLELFEYASPPPARGREVEPRTIGLTHVCLLVADLPRLFEGLRDRGVDSWFSPPVEIDSGANRGGRALYLRDPDGVILELFEPAR